ncbi:Homologous-pairing protein [Sphaerulina musiva]
MAPTKKDGDVKEKKLSPDESSKLILDYLRTTNRPYSATDISANLSNKVTKAAATKLLKDMHERKEIDGKAAGKQIVYFAVQEEVEEGFEEAMQAKEAKMEEYRETIATLKAQEKELRQSLRSRASATTTTLPELQACVEKMEQEKLALADRLARLQSGSIKPVDPEKRARLMRERKKWAKISAARKKIRKELWETVLESVVEKERIEEIKEEIGIQGIF